MFLPFGLSGAFCGPRGLLRGDAMRNRIKGVDAGSPAERAGLRPGERLAGINGNAIADVLDYKFYSYEPRLELELLDENGVRRAVRVKKREGEDLGLDFETYLMDKAHSCANRCIFCFIDQLPRGMRESLYFKDDDARLSFLLGNYITLTNLSEREVRRMIDLRISPVNISVHATDPDVRGMMLGNARGGGSLDIMRRFYEAGIHMNCQIVLCPGVNDGEVLSKSLYDLCAMYPEVNSVSVVPVGLTRHRQGLYPLTAVDRDAACKAVELVEKFGADCMGRHDYRVVYASDELYLAAGKEIPPMAYYDDFPQLENGVGMLRLFIDDFEYYAGEKRPPARPRPFSIATGVAAAPFLSALLDFAAAKWHNIEYHVYAVENHFFGSCVTVAGLITGQDLAAQLKGKDLGERLILPNVMLRDGGGMFLDGMTVDELSAALGVPVFISGTGAEDLIAGILEEK